MRETNLPQPVTEYYFHDFRNWRIDFAWPEIFVAVEIEGRGHASYYNYLSDIDKYNNLAFLKWRLFRFIPEMVESGEAIADMKLILAEYPKSPIILVGGPSLEATPHELP